AIRELAAQVEHVTAGEHLRALLLADIEVRFDLLKLVVRSLGTDHGVGIEGVTSLDTLSALYHRVKKVISDRCLNECARRARADLALVEGKHGEALLRLVPVVIVFRHHVVKEDIRALASELERDRNDVLARVLHDESTGCGLARERNLA